MAQSDSEIVKSKVDIVDIIGARVELKKAGRHFKGPCPFHSENDPSFIVSPELQIYKCFGCGRSGDVFTFLQEYEGMDFVESLEYLAEKVNFTLTRLSKSDSQKKKLIDMHSSVNNFYKYILLSHPYGKKARDYLSGRGITKKTIETFDIGYSPQDPASYIKYVVGKKKYSLADLDRAGLAYTTYGRPKDRFSGRITFPLSDHRGVILGYAGRILPENDTGKVGKYINSPETEIYHKSKMLYGLSLAKESIRRKNLAILVEGELDMISSYQAGVRNTVAIKGSALTSEQTLLLKRFTDRIILALDGDFAGNAAAMRGIEVAEETGLSVKVATLGEFKDPDEAIRADLSKYKEILKSSKNVWDFLIDGVFDRNDADTGAGKQKISREVIPILRSIKDSIVRSHYVGVVSDRLSIDRQAVLDQLQKNQTGESRRSQDPPLQEKVTRRKLLEENFLSLCFQFDSNRIDRKSARLIKDRKFSAVVDDFIKYRKSNKSIDLQKFSSTLPSHLTETFQLLVLVLVDVSADMAQKEIDLVQKEIEILDIRNQMKELGKLTGKYESEGNKKELDKTQKKLTGLTRELSKLSN